VLPEFGFTPDGGRLVAFHPGGVRVWDLAAGGPPAVLRGAQGAPRLTAVSPDGRRLVLVSERAPVREVSRPELRLWDLTSGQELLAAEVAFPLPRPNPDRGSYPAFDGRVLRLFGTGPRGAEVGVLDGSPPGP
jgi:hypothetical protein